jgi:molybdopterin-binding protein
MKLSARNQLPAKVTNVTEGPATAVVELDVNGLRLVASVTAEAARELALAEGSEVTAIIKASDVILGVA